MVRKGFGLALIDEQMKLEPTLTTRPIAGVRWTADTAFVHHSNGEHLALPLLTRHLGKSSNQRLRKPEQRKKSPEPVQLELLS
jgi:hypothetical protein